VYTQIQAMGEPVILDDEEMTGELEKSSRYGVQD